MSKMKNFGMTDNGEPLSDAVIAEKSKDYNLTLNKDLNYIKWLDNLKGTRYENRTNENK